MTKRPHILIVDDDEALSENIGDILNTLSLPIKQVTSGVAAIEYAKENFVAIALVDLWLPDGNGADLIEKLRKIDSLTKVVIITGDATTKSAISAVHAGAFAYVTKPFSPRDLIETSRRALAQVELLQEKDRLQRDLSNSEKRHREIVETLPAFVLALDEKDNIVFWNKSLEIATGYSLKEMLGKPGRALVGSGEPARLATKTKNAIRVRWQKTDPLSSGTELGWTYAVGIDVTKEQEMLRRTFRAERLAAVGTMAAGLVHEIRNPLNSALLQIALLERRISKMQGPREDVLATTQIVREEIQRLEHLVQDFLAFARPQPLAVKPTDIVALCDSVIGFIQAEAAQRGVKAIAHHVAPLPLVEADPERLRQVLLNLLRNGLEAMPKGGSLEIATRRGRGPGDQASVDVSVSDTGCGFPTDDPVFDAFFTTKATGSGLGLSIVHRIVTDHGGTLTVRSKPGATKFTMSFPVEDSAPEVS